MKDGNNQPQRWVLRLFAGSWAAILAGAAYLLGGTCQACRWPLYVLAAMIATGLLFPAAMRRPYRWVDLVLAPVGRLFALVVMALVYYLVFTPFALGLRLVGWDPLRRRGGATAWRARPQGVQPGDYRWQY